MNMYLFGWRSNFSMKARDTGIKLLMMILLCTLFLILYYSSGINTFLSKNWKVTIFLKGGVPDEKGELFSERIGRLSFVSDSNFQSSQDVWKNFASNLSDPEEMKDVIGDQVPGYIEVRLKRGSIDEKNLKKLITIADKEEISGDVLYGGSGFYRMLKIKKYLNGSIIVSFGFFLALVSIIFYFMDAGFQLAVSKEVVYAGEHIDRGRGSESGWIAGSLIEGIASGALSFALSIASIKLVMSVVPGLVQFVSFPAGLNISSYLLPLFLVLIYSTALYILSALFAGRKIGEIITGER